MSELKKVLLATDFSESSANALQHARALVEQFQAELHVLHVYVEPVQIYGVSGLSIPAQPSQEVREKLHEKVTEWCAGDAIKVAEVEKDYSVSMAIRRYADEQGIDLIVIGTQGRQGASRFFLGSVAAEVIRTANCPVLVVGLEHIPPVDGYSKVLAAVDFSEASLAALSEAANLAKRFNSTLTALHVVDIGNLPPYYPDEFAKIELSHAQQALNDLLTPVARDVQVDDLVSYGDPHKVIAEVAMDTGIDLIVMGTAGLRGLKGMLTGSVADRVVRSAVCPVLVLHNPLLAAEKAA